MCGDGNPWLCFGLPLEHSTTIVGILDVVLGGVSATIFAMLVDLTYNYAGYHEYYEYRGPAIYKTLFGRPAAPPEVYLTLLIGSVMQIVMGIILSVGAVKRSSLICKIWMAITWFILVISWDLPFRLYGIRVVYSFYGELKNEEQMRNLNERPPHLQMSVTAQARQQPNKEQYPHPQIRNQQIRPIDLEAQHVSIDMRFPGSTPTPSRIR